jgi:LuxR family maltose regulon positive regulatory protein
LACQSQGDITQALTALEKALSLAEPEGYVRIFADEGEPMVRLLRQAMARGIALKYVSKLLASCDASEYESVRASSSRTCAQPLLEPFSKRELEVLRLLTTDLSTPEMAQELFVSVHTVRSHVKRIYSKLNVHRRMDAIQRAEELELINRNLGPSREAHDDRWVRI